MLSHLFSLWKIRKCSNGTVRTGVNVARFFRRNRAICAGGLSRDIPLPSITSLLNRLARRVNSRRRFFRANSPLFVWLYPVDVVPSDFSPFYTSRSVFGAPCPCVLAAKIGHGRSKDHVKCSFLPAVSAIRTLPIQRSSSPRDAFSDSIRIPHD